MIQSRKFLHKSNLMLTFDILFLKKMEVFFTQKCLLLLWLWSIFVLVVLLKYWYCLLFVLDVNINLKKFILSKIKKNGITDKCPIISHDLCPIITWVLVMLPKLFMYSHYSIFFNCALDNFPILFNNSYSQLWKFVLMCFAYELGRAVIYNFN